MGVIGRDKLNALCAVALPSSLFEDLPSCGCSWLSRAGGSGERERRVARLGREAGESPVPVLATAPLSSRKISSDLSVRRVLGTRGGRGGSGVMLPAAKFARASSTTFSTLRIQIVMRSSLLSAATCSFRMAWRTTGKELLATRSQLLETELSQ